MNQTTIGVDTSVSSPSSTVVIDHVTANSENATVTFTYPDAPNPAIHPLVEHMSTVVQIVNGIVTPNLRVLLASVLGAIDASIPNKDQNRAVRHIVRKQFDDAYGDILRRSYPDTNLGFDGGYAIEPEVDRSKAFAQGFLKQG